MDLRKNDIEDWRNETSDPEKKSKEVGLPDAREEKLKPNSEVKKINEKWL